MLQLDTQNHRSHRVWRALWSRECETMRISDAISFGSDFFLVFSFSFLAFFVHGFTAFCVYVLFLDSALNWMGCVYASRKEPQDAFIMPLMNCHADFGSLFALTWLHFSSSTSQSSRNYCEFGTIWPITVCVCSFTYSQFNWRYLVNECTVMQRHCHCRRRRRQLSIVSNRMGWQKVGQRGWTRLHLRTHCVHRNFDVWQLATA